MSSQHPEKSLLLPPLLLALLIHLLFFVLLGRITPGLNGRQTAASNDIMLQVALRDRPPEPAKSVVKPVSEKSPAVTERATEEVKPAITQAPHTTAPANPENRAASPGGDSRFPDREVIFRQSLAILMADKDSERTPGTASGRGLPRNWTRKAIDYRPTRFKRAELPARAVVLDQWKGADGSAHSRIKLPGGDIVCGSRAPKNDLDIYSLPIWTWRAC